MHQSTSIESSFKIKDYLSVNLLILVLLIAPLLWETVTRVMSHNQSELLKNKSELHLELISQFENCTEGYFSSSSIECFVALSSYSKIKDASQTDIRLVLIDIDTFLITKNKKG